MFAYGTHDTRHDHRLAFRLKFQRPERGAGVPLAGGLDPLHDHVDLIQRGQDRFDQGPAVALAAGHVVEPLEVPVDPRDRIGRDHGGLSPGLAPKVFLEGIRQVVQQAGSLGVTLTTERERDELGLAAGGPYKGP